MKTQPLGALTSQRGRLYSLSYCSVDAYERSRTSSTHLIINFRHLYRLKWLASISEVLELWVSAALTSHGNLPMIGSNNLGDSRSASNEVSLFRGSSHIFIPPCFECFKTFVAVAFLHLLAWLFLADSSDQHRALETN